MTDSFPSSNGVTDDPAPAEEQIGAALAQRSVALSAALAACTDEEFLELDSTISAGLRQINRGVQDVADGLVRLAFGLAHMEVSQAYTRAGFSSFEQYVKQRHGLSLNAARNYILALRELGSDGYRDLFINAGAQRTFLAAHLKRLAPTWELLDELLLSGEEGKPLIAALPVSALQQTLDRLKVEVEQAREREAELIDRLARQRRSEQNLEQVLSDVRTVNFELVGLRDKVERDLTKQVQLEQSQHAQTRKALRELEQEMAKVKAHRASPGTPTMAARRDDTAAARHTSPAAPREESSTSLVVEAPQTEVVKQVVEVISAQCDPLLMADMVRSTIAALRRYQEGAAQVSSAEALPLYEAISDLIATGDVSLVSMVVKGCAVALRCISSSAAIPAKDDAALQKTLTEFSDAIRVLYPTGPRAPHAAHR